LFPLIEPKRKAKLRNREEGGGEQGRNKVWSLEESLNKA
jgi:hypothetical protein